MLAALKRHDIDTALFFFGFLADVDENTKEKLTKSKNKYASETEKFVTTKFMRSDTVKQKLEQAKAKAVELSKTNKSSTQEKSKDGEAD